MLCVTSVLNTYACFFVVVDSLGYDTMLVSTHFSTGDIYVHNKNWCHLITHRKSLKQMGINISWLVTRIDIVSRLAYDLAAAFQWRYTSDDQTKATSEQSFNMFLYALWINSATFLEDWWEEQNTPFHMRVHRSPLIHSNGQGVKLKFEDVSTRYITFHHTFLLFINVVCIFIVPRGFYYFWRRIVMTYLSKCKSRCLGGYKCDADKGYVWQAKVNIIEYLWY